MTIGQVDHIISHFVERYLCISHFPISDFRFQISDFRYGFHGMVMVENKDYKYLDYLNRINDPYAKSKYKIVMIWLPKQDNLKILNVGCGSGEMNILLSMNPTWEIDAIDIDKDAINLSQNLKINLNIKNLNIFHADIKNYKPQKQYDVIITNDVLEHIDDDITAIRNLSDMLKPKGMICISVPALKFLFGYHDEMLGHYRRYNKKKLRNNLSRFFEVKKCLYFGMSLIPIAFLYSKLFRKSYPLSNLHEKSFRTNLINSILKLESDIGVPIGISLLAMGHKK